MGISKVVLNGVTQMDVTSDTVTASNLLEGETATAADGEKVTGIMTQNLPYTLISGTFSPSTSRRMVISDSEIKSTSVLLGMRISCQTLFGNLVSPEISRIYGSKQSDTASAFAAYYKGSSGELLEMEGNYITVTFSDGACAVNISSSSTAKFRISSYNVKLIIG